MATIAMRRCNYLILLLAVPILLFGSATSSPYNSNSRTSPPSTKVLSISSSNADVAAVPSHHRRHLSKVLSLNRGGGAEGARSLTSTVDAIWKAHPLVAGATVCAVKASLADLVAQNIQFRATRTAAKKFRRRMVESQKFDFRRTFAFMLFGGLYQGKQVLYPVRSVALGPNPIATPLLTHKLTLLVLVSLPTYPPTKKRGCTGVDD